ncbi:MAG: peptidoglycan-binding domain-containing protein [Rhizonema sp. NSF051]|nr:peptidoglycan-binding domain-containing protein [Rhizonema sp. NSF051]
MPKPTVFLSIASTGEDVECVQKILKSLGYDVTIDGLFGLQTETAVRRYQSDKNLTVDGIVNAVVFNILVNENY